MRETLTTSEELRLEVHVIEGVDGLVVVGLDLSCKACMVSKSVGDTSGLPSMHEPLRNPCASRSLWQREGRDNSPSGTSSRPLSAMFAVEALENLDQAQLDLELINRGVTEAKNEGRTSTREDCALVSFGRKETGID